MCGEAGTSDSIQIDPGSQATIHANGCARCGSLLHHFHHFCSHLLPQCGQGYCQVNVEDHQSFQRCTKGKPTMLVKNLCLESKFKMIVNHLAEMHFCLTKMLYPSVCKQKPGNPHIRSPITHNTLQLFSLGQPVIMKAKWV